MIYIRGMFMSRLMCTKTINETELIMRQEYYPNTKILRSKGFFINGKRDSIWKAYDKHGKIIEETVYKNGIAVGSRK